MSTPAAPAKKAAAKPKKPVLHPKYSEMIVAAIKALKERNGSSRQGLLKYIMANYNVGGDAKAVNAHLKQALKRGVATKTLKQVKGAGASGSFKVGEVAKPAKKPAKKPAAKKPAAKKAKKPAAKKSAAKKPAAKKSPKKAKSPKPKKTPVKKAAKKPAAKKPAPKKTAAKKSPAKKAAKKPAAKKSAKKPAKKA